MRSDPFFSFLGLLLTRGALASDTSTPLARNPGGHDAQNDSVDSEDSIEAGSVGTASEASIPRRPTRFAGRSYEISRIQDALNQAEEGRGQVIAVTGEAGIGKSRLFREFKLVSQNRCRVLEAGAVSYEKTRLYQPLIELLECYFGLAPNDNEAVRRQKVTRKALGLDADLEEAIPYICWLLRIETTASPLRRMSPETRRYRKLQALTRLFLCESLRQTLVLVFEDLHRLDSGSRSFLDRLAKEIGSANILLLVDHPAEYRYHWGSKRRYTEIRLSPLNEAETEEFLATRLGGDLSLFGLSRILPTLTGGMPFFMEEAIHSLIEEGALVGEPGNYQLIGAPYCLNISPTVQGVLATRLGRLSKAEKSVLQQLSVIGGNRPFGFVKHVIDLPEETLRRVLASLQNKAFLDGRGSLSEPCYSFRHYLTRDLVYRALLQKQRRTLHERVGRTIEKLYRETLDEHFGELAHHYGHSDNTDKAIVYMRLAGEQEAQRCCRPDAIEDLQKALASSEEIPDSPERGKQKAAFQASLLASLGSTEHGGFTRTEQDLVRV